MAGRWRRAFIHHPSNIPTTSSRTQWSGTASSKRVQDSMLRFCLPYNNDRRAGFLIQPHGSSRVTTHSRRRFLGKLLPGTESQGRRTDQLSRLLDTSGPARQRNKVDANQLCDANGRPILQVDGLIPGNNYSRIYSQRTKSRCKALHPYFRLASAIPFEAIRSGKTSSG